MLHYLRENRRILICTVLALIAGMLLGYVLQPSEAPGQSVQNQAEAAPVDRIGVVSILPTTRVERETCFLQCGHTVISTLENASGFTGLTKTELADRYPKAIITSFSSDLVHIVERFEGYCPEHFVLLSAEEGMLKVMRMQAETLASAGVLPEAETLENVCVLEIPDALEGLDAETAEQLQQGEAFSSLDEINRYLENLES